MCKFKEIITTSENIGYTYLDRFYEKLAYTLSENIDKEISAMRILTKLADEVSFTDDGYLYYIVDSEFNIDATEDIRFKVEHRKKNNNYMLLINDKSHMMFDSLTSALKASIEEYFYV